MQFNAFHNQLAPSSCHPAAMGLVCAHHYHVHALHSSCDNGINTLPVRLAAQCFQQEQVLAYLLHGLDQKVMELQPQVQGSGSHRTLRCRATGARPVLHGVRAGHGEHGGT